MNQKLIWTVTLCFLFFIMCIVDTSSPFRSNRIRNRERMEIECTRNRISNNNIFAVIKAFRNRAWENFKYFLNYMIHDRRDCLLSGIFGIFMIYLGISFLEFSSLHKEFIKNVAQENGDLGKVCKTFEYNRGQRLPFNMFSITRKALCDRYLRHST